MVRAGPADYLRAFNAELAFVARTLRRHGVRRPDAEDLAQEVFLVAWRRWADFDVSQPLRPWLAGIAFNLAYRHHRRRKPELGHDQAADAPDQAPRAEQHLEAAETRALVLEALARLPERHRAVLVLHDLEGATVEEIALRWALPRFTVYTRLRRARLAFAKVIDHLLPPDAAERNRGIIVFVVAVLKRCRGGVVSLLGAVGALVLLSAGGTTRPSPVPVPPAIAESLRLTRPASRRSLPVLALSARTGSVRTGEPAPPAHRDPHLVGHWPFDDPPGSARAVDHSGRGHDCVLRRLDPDLAWVPGNRGGAIELGFNGWLECQQPPLPQRPAAAVSVAAWVKRAGNPHHHHAIAMRAMGGRRANYFFFGFDDDRLMVMSSGWQDQGVLSAPLSDAPGAWLHVAFTHGADHQTRLFVNGTEVARRTNKPRRQAATEAPLLVGGGLTGHDRTRVGQLFEGSLDELRIYERALDDREIRALASDGPGRGD